MAKRKKKSRVREFRQKRRKSWIKFLTTIFAFMVPAIAIIAYIYFVIPPSGQVPVVLLGYHETIEDTGRVDVFQLPPSSIRAAENDPQQPIEFGGTDGNVLFVYTQLLSTTDFKDGDTAAAQVPVVFVPSDREEYHTHHFRGIASEESSDEQTQWLEFMEYLPRLVNRIAGTQAYSTARHMVIGFDLRHPDFPAALPPNANEFMRLIERNWQDQKSRLSEYVAERANKNLHLTLVFSHRANQYNYLHSDSKEVSTFFQRRFGRLMTFDPDADEDGDDKFSLAEFKNYLLERVEADASIHQLAQQPLILSRETDANDVSIAMEVRSRKDAKQNLFAVPPRGNGQELDDRWRTFEEVSRREQWLIENPLAFQRCNLLLLQMEQLWYAALDQTGLYQTLDGKLTNLLAAKLTIQPIVHSLRDQEAHARRTGDPTGYEPFDLDWLVTDESVETNELNEAETKVDDQSADGDGEPQSEPTTAPGKKKGDPIALWQDNNRGWLAALAVWEAFVQGDSKQVTAENILAAIDCLEQKTVLEDDGTSSDVYWSEIAFLERLATEFFPYLEGTRSSGLSGDEASKCAHEAIRARDLANKFSANLSPIMVDKFVFENGVTASNENFPNLENQMRELEDHMFANHGNATGLIKRYIELIGTPDGGGLEFLIKQQEDLQNQLERRNRQLIEYPHFLRYSISNLLLQDQFGMLPDAGTTTTAPDQTIQQLVQLHTQYSPKEEAVEREDVEATIDRIKTQQNEFQKHLGAVYQSFIKQSQSETQLSSAPQTDEAELNRKKLDAKTAQGNTHRRKLMQWPSLKPSTRRDFRAGLLSNSIVTENLEGEIPGSSRVFSFSKLRQRKVERLSQARIDGLEGKMFSTLDECAFHSHLWLVDTTEVKESDRTSSDQVSSIMERIVCEINRVHAEKSNYDFDRVVHDNWGSRFDESGKSPFVISGLAHHCKTVQSRHAEILYENAREPWITQLVEYWWGINEKDKRIGDVANFAANFRNGNHWSLSTDRRTLENSQIDPFVKEESRSKNEFCLRAQQSNRILGAFPRVLETANSAEVSRFRSVSRDALSSASEFEIYLRGHLSKKKAKIKRAPQTLVVGTSMTHERKPGALMRLQNKRDVNNRRQGTITFVIDCSVSMTNEMESMKNNLKGFLRRLSQREDFHVRMFAIGARYNLAIEGTDLIEKPRNELEDWLPYSTNMRQFNDVNFFQHNDRNQLLTAENLPEYERAIDQLEAFGQTPILEGLKAATEANPNVAKQHLTVLLTDGFEYTLKVANDGVNKDVLWDQVVYNQLDERWQKMSNGVTLEIAEYEAIADLERIQTKSKDADYVFKNGALSGLKIGEVIERIQLIRKLAPHAQKKSRNFSQLDEFLEGLLPNPKFIFLGEVDPSSDQRRIVKSDVMFTKQDLNKPWKRRKPLASIPLGSADNPETWDVQVRFDEKQGASRIFSQEPKNWESKNRLFGNERLMFAYDPVEKTLELVTEREALSRNSVETRLSESDVVVSPQFDHPILIDEPQFSIFSKSPEPYQLTPAPELAFILARPVQGESAMLIQDFTLAVQTSSNVHPLEFTEISNELQAAFSIFNGKADLELFLKPTEAAWTVLEIGTQKSGNWSEKFVKARGKQAQLGGLEVDLKEEELVEFGERHNDYEIKLDRLDKDGLLCYQVTVARGRNQANPVNLDQWLVQIVDQNDRIDHGFTLKTNREYVFEQRGSKRTLLAIRHQFFVDRNDEAEQFRIGILSVEDVIPFCKNLKFPFNGD